LARERASYLQWDASTTDVRQECVFPELASESSFTFHIGTGNAETWRQSVATGTLEEMKNRGPGGPAGQTSRNEVNGVTLPGQIRDTPQNTGSKMSRIVPASPTQLASSICN
jgi:hypothetical protein